MSNILIEMVLEMSAGWTDFFWRMIILEHYINESKYYKVLLIEIPTKQLLFDLVWTL